METAATPGRDLRTFLLVAPFDANEIGARIKQARLEAGLSQEDLSALATFAQRSLQNYETGKTIPFKHLREIGELLNRETSWFLYGDLDPRRDDAGEVLDLLRSLEVKVAKAAGDLAVALRELGASLARIEERLPHEAPQTRRAR